MGTDVDDLVVVFWNHKEETFDPRGILLFIRVDHQNKVGFFREIDVGQSERNGVGYLLGSAKNDVRRVMLPCLGSSEGGGRDLEFGDAQGFVEFDHFLTFYNYLVFFFFPMEKKRERERKKKNVPHVYYSWISFETET